MGKVFVYFNLHKKVWSVRDQKTRKVIAHLQSVYIKDATFKVSEAGRQRVLAEKKKNVHAGVEGYLYYPDHYEVLALLEYGTQVSYNPYKASTFVRKESGLPVQHSALVLLADKKCFSLNPI
jgi:hypothetical protein